MRTVLFSPRIAKPEYTRRLFSTIAQSHDTSRAAIRLRTYQHEAFACRAAQRIAVAHASLAKPVYICRRWQDKAAFAPRRLTLVPCSWSPRLAHINLQHLIFPARLAVLPLWRAASLLCSCDHHLQSSPPRP